MEKILGALSLADAVTYFVLGFIFLRVFRYICTLKNSDEHDHILWESVAAGFILKQFYDLIPSVSSAVDTLGMIAATIIISAFLAKVYSSRHMNDFLLRIGVHRTKNKYIWNDIEDPDYRIIADVIDPDTNEAYHGVVIYYEEFKEHPQIVLNYYKYYEDWHSGKAAMDFSDDPSKTVIVETEKFSRITISYDKKSSKIKTVETVDDS